MIPRAARHESVAVLNIQIRDSTRFLSAFVSLVALIALPMLVTDNRGLEAALPR